MMVGRVGKVGIVLHSFGRIESFDTVEGRIVVDFAEVHIVEAAAVNIVEGHKPGSEAAEADMTGMDSEGCIQSSPAMAVVGMASAAGNVNIGMGRPY